MSVGFPVMARQCATCIYRPDSALDLAALEAAIADPRMAGFFTGYRVCHHAPRGTKACCAGFWARHKDQFAVGQLAQRLGFARFVSALGRHRKPKKGSRMQKAIVRVALAIVAVTVALSAQAGDVAGIVGAQPVIYRAAAQSLWFVRQLPTKSDADPAVLILP